MASIENIHRPDNTLAKIKSTLEYDFSQLQEGTNLTVFVSNFNVWKIAIENCWVIDSIIRLVAEHPWGNAVCFSQIFLVPTYCKVPSMTNHTIPTPVPNHFAKFKDIKSHIVTVIKNFGSGSAFGSIKKHPYGYTRDLKHWSYYAWQGSQLGVPERILNCDSLKV